MELNNQKSFLQFDFKSTGGFTHIQFTSPIEVITTDQIDEVNNCLLRISEVINEGKYVAGYLSYEASHAFYPSQNRRLKNTAPLLWFGVYHSPSKYTQQNKSPFHVGEWATPQLKSDYEKTFRNIMNELKRGTFEQINYTVPFYTSFTGNPFSYYEQLRHAQQSDYNAFLKIGDHHILSISPELFFHLNDHKITVKPMKGTIHRGKTYDEDLKLKRWLQNSEKNILENDLSVQLMKDELKAITIHDSISFLEKYDIEQYPTLYQMTSTITGEVSPNLEVTDIIKHLFPSVSITGTPKDAAIDYISQIEQQPRHVYCGTIGYITPDQEAIFNIPIRTVIINEKDQQAIYNAGGAITINSNVEEEYEEVLTKTKILYTPFQPFQLLETIGLHHGKLIVLDLHLKRLKQSAKYFSFNIFMKEIENDLLSLAHTYFQGNWKIRLLSTKSGQYSLDITPLENIKTNQFVIADTPINKENHLLFHKTTVRKIYENHQVNDSSIFDTLLWNEDGEITEFTIGNVVVEFDGELLTPPITCGLLPGTFREKLLLEKKVKEAIIYKGDLKKCTKVWLINSVRQWVEVTFDRS